MRREIKDGFELDDDPRRLDIDAVHAFISTESYWGLGRSRELVELAIEGSTRVLGLYRGSQLVGFARAVSDDATFAYLADVYVLPTFRGRGLGVELVREMVDGGTGGAGPLDAAHGRRAGPLREARLQRPAAALPADGTRAARAAGPAAG